MRRGLLLFAHGAREPGWAAPFRAVADRLGTTASGVAVELAFLEFMAPDLAGAADRLVAAGATCIDVLPLFLGTGGHLRRDLPQLVDAVRRSHPTLEITLHAAVGEHEAVVAAMAGVAASIAGFGE